MIFKKNPQLYKEPRLTCVVAVKQVDQDYATLQN